MSALTPEAILLKINNLPSLPTVVMALLASMGQEDVNVEALANTIAQDQALTAKTLRLANSSFYGMAKQVTTLHEAITILGFRTVRSLATTAALMGAFDGKNSVSLNVTPFWRHAIAAAVCARVLARHLSVNPDYAYTAGLLHDIGRLILVTQFQAEYEATMAYRVAHDCSLLEAERAVLGLDHAEVGLMLTQNWKFPEELQQALAQHHAAQAMGLPTLTVLVMAANTIAHALDLSLDPDDLVPPVPHGLWQQLGLPDPVLLDVFQQTEQQFEAASSVLST